MSINPSIHLSVCPFVCFVTLYLEHVWPLSSNFVENLICEGVVWDYRWDISLKKSPQRNGSDVVDLLCIITPIVHGGSVFVIVLVCNT